MVPRAFGGPARRRRAATLAAWLAFVSCGLLLVMNLPLWEGFDEPFHLAYLTFVARHGRPPGYLEPSMPVEYARIGSLLPSWFPHAPSFEKWRRQTPLSREAVRREAAQVGSGMVGAPRYLGTNYERQHPPLFYYAAAPAAWLLRGASLPVFLVGMRFFCVLLASLMVPLTARLARLLLPQRAVFLALPLAALLPNTLFFADRITNDALAWPIFAAAAGQLVLVARRPSRRSALGLGLLAAAGPWSKMTLLPLLPAALAAVLLARRRRSGRRLDLFALAVALPAALVAPLLAWNRSASGVWSGITYNILPLHADLPAVFAQWHSLEPALLFGYWGHFHLWSGGWEFLQPAPGVDRAVGAGLLALGLVCLASARSRGAGWPGGTRWLPLACLCLFFLGAMLFHALAAAAAGNLVGKPPLAGGEGWYFDVLRPIEACAAAAMLCAAMPARRVGQAAAALVALLLAGHALGWFGLLLPHWAGTPGAVWSLPGLAQTAEGARQAAPVLYPPSAAVVLAVCLVASSLALVAIAARPHPASGSLSAG